MEFASKYAYNYGGESSYESDGEADDSPLNKVDLVVDKARSSTRSVGAPIQQKSKVPNTPQPRPLLPRPSSKKKQTKKVAPPPPPPPSGSSRVTLHARAPPLSSKKKQKKKVRKTDTNVLSVKFGCLEEKTFTSATKPVKCSQCPAVMSNLEHPVNYLNAETGNTSMKWICAFCGASNSVAESDAKTERKEDMLYVPEDQVVTPEKTDGQAEVKKEGEESVDLEDDSILLFTLDISGSMGMPVHRRKDLEDHSEYDSEDLFEDGQYLSSLDIMKAALIQRIEDMKTAKPNVKLGVVTFSTEVEYLADGTRAKQRSLSKSDVYDKDAIQKEGIACKTPGPLKHSADRLKTTIEGMHADALTALGPALLMSVAIAGQQNQCKVIICTDGEANVGIGDGSFDSSVDDFYDYVAEYANEFGVSVSVLSIEGDDCGLAYLGKVADATNGSVNIVNPEDLGTEYAGIISQKIVGSKVEVTLVLHTSMFIRDALNPNDKSKSWMKVNIGNVTSDSENFFEFGFKAKQPGDTNEDTDELKEVPFQLQISYVNKHKSQLLRVITAKMPCTKERSKAEEEADMALMGAHAIQSTAQISKQREYTMAQSNASSKKAWFKEQETTRGSQFTAVQAKLGATTISELACYAGVLQREQRDEAMTFGGDLSDDDCSEDLESKRQKKITIRSRTQKDSSANMMFAKSKMTTSAMLKK